MFGSLKFESEIKKRDMSFSPGLIVQADIPLYILAVGRVQRKLVCLCTNEDKEKLKYIAPAALQITGKTFDIKSSKYYLYVV